jgi:hypothetical protein
MNRPARAFSPYPPLRPETPVRRPFRRPADRPSSRPILEFLCRPEDRGVIAEPRPARAVLPDWFRRLPAVDEAVLGPRSNGLTVKRCMPFLDAMATGWIIPLAATVRMEIRDGGTAFDCGWEFDRTMVSNHEPYQIAGHPAQPRPPGKFHNYWTVRTRPGWSCLFLPPLNRDPLPFVPLAGVVDTDAYASLIHFPFIPVAPDGLYEIEKGTPLVQVIPFRRDATQVEAVIRAETPEDAAARERIRRATQAEDGWYRRQARALR